MSQASTRASAWSRSNPALSSFRSVRTVTALIPSFVRSSLPNRLPPSGRSSERRCRVVARHEVGAALFPRCRIRIPPESRHHRRERSTNPSARPRGSPPRPRRPAAPTGREPLGADSPPPALLEDGFPGFQWGIRADDRSSEGLGTSCLAEELGTGAIADRSRAFRDSRMNGRARGRGAGGLCGGLWTPRRASRGRFS